MIGEKTGFRLFFGFSIFASSAAKATADESVFGFRGGYNENVEKNRVRAYVFSEILFAERPRYRDNGRRDDNFAVHPTVARARPSPT